MSKTVQQKIAPTQPGGTGSTVIPDWNATAREYPAALGVAEIFETQVERTPDALAVVWGEQRFTYRELNVRASQLAHLLRSRGVGLETPVGICVERSPLLVIAMLAICKAGGSYLPLDTRYPKERLAFMLEDAQAPVVLSEQRSKHCLPPHGAVTLMLDSDWHAVAAQPTVNLTPLATGEHRAYIMYTSGSTGRPKGVEVLHKGISRLVLNTNYVELTAADRVAQISNASFDAATFEIWGALLNGGQLVGVAKDVVLSPSAFATQIQAQGITVMFLTAALFDLMVREVPTAFRAMRYLLVGGDVVSPDRAREVLTQGPPAHLINGYGPTESTTFAVCHRIHEVREGATSIPIGRPIANTQIYILDEERCPVPVGMPGELYIAGDGLARGYLNRTELTEERFVWHTLLGKSLRLYRTGDLASWLPDGSIEFLGRADRQIKLRGFRVDLGEIESVLMQNPMVQQCVVEVRLDSAGEKSLVAYVVPSLQHGASGTPRDSTAQRIVARMRQHLDERLPGYMVPSHILLLDELPLSLNGKLDRQALPPPPVALDEPTVAPRTAVEKELVDIWCQVLGLEGVGVHHSFLALGGHSLQAAQVVARVHERLAVDLPIASLYGPTTIAELAESISRSLHDRTDTAPESMRSVPRDSHLPLSRSQRQMWFVAQMSEAPVYNETVALELSGALDVRALQMSFDELIWRHEIWRTVFPQIDGQPVQRVRDDMSFALSVVDLRQVEPARQLDEAVIRATVEAQRPFDLEAGPLLRATLMVLGADKHLLFLQFHHITLDGVSLYNVFLVELSRLYAAHHAGRSLDLPPPVLHYADVAAWQAERVGRGELDRQMSYWKRQLRDVSMVQLPYDRPRPIAQSFRGAKHTMKLSQRLSAELKALSQAEGVTLFMTLLTGLKVLLHRYSGQQDLVVGTVRSGLPRAESERVMGPLFNMLVLRTTVDESCSVRRMLHHVRTVSVDAYVNADVPFEQLVEELNPQRSRGHNPLFQIALVVNPPEPALETSWSISELEIDNHTAKFDLTLFVTDRPDGLRLCFEYSTDLFDGETIARMAGHLQVLLAGMVHDPAQQVARLPLLTPEERHQLLVEWNATRADYPRDACFHQMFEAQVERAPDAIALVFGEQELTYRELNARGNRLAHYLRSLGAGPGMLLGLCLSRSPEMVIALLAILKTGGAYVPLDPEYPIERLRFMLEDCRASILVTRRELVDRLRSDRARTVLLDLEEHAIAQQCAHNPASGVTPQDLAYVMYTSGSTGQPKGVMLEHGGVCNLAAAQRRLFNPDIGDRGLQFFSFSFDASVWELTMTLCHGAALVMAPQSSLLPGPELAGLLRDQEITMLIALPSVLMALPAEELPKLRTLFVGVEASSAEVVARWGSERRMFNVYGPTEATVLCTIGECRDRDRPPPIGRPIDNMQTFILDSSRQPVPIGVAGELYIGGVGVARGYLNRPDLTTDRFIDSPVPEYPGRLYKTGDQVKWLPDGNIHFLGRIDRQIKLGGFRIEPGEIEAVLGEQPEVGEAVVGVVEPRPGDKRLVAYVTARGTAPAELPQTLSERVKQRLPRFMLPAAFVVLDKLPLLPNGKVDHKALPAPAEFGVASNSTYEPARGEMERTIAAIWQEVLGRERVGVNDNFFDLGGQSLLLVQMRWRLETALGRKLPITALFQYPTVRSLAAHLSAEPLDDSGPVQSSVLERSRERWKKSAEAMQHRRAQKGRDR